MLREFLRKIFSPPRALEDKRIERDDFDRLKRPVKHDEDDSAEQSCPIEHGPLSQHHWQHMPLTRSVSMRATQSAYEHYLQRNAARADNWAEFDEILHPTLGNHDIDGKPASFLTAEEEQELAMPKPAVAEKPLNTYLKPPSSMPPGLSVTPQLVQSAERVVHRHAVSVALTGTKHWSFNSAYGSKKPKWLSKELAYKYCKGWLKKKAASDETEPAGLRELAKSALTNVRLAVAANEHIPFDCLWNLAHDGNAEVRLELAKNPNCTIELLEKLSADPNEQVATTAREILHSITG